MVRGVSLPFLAPLQPLLLGASGRHTAYYPLRICSQSEKTRSDAPPPFSPPHRHITCPLRATCLGLRVAEYHAGGNFCSGKVSPIQHVLTSNQAGRLISRHDSRGWQTFSVSATSWAFRRRGPDGLCCNCSNLQAWWEQ